MGFFFFFSIKTESRVESTAVYLTEAVLSAAGQTVVSHTFSVHTELSQEPFTVKTHLQITIN